MRTAPPGFSYFCEFFSDPWRSTIVAILALGIIADFFRSILSPIINLAVYLVWLVTFLWEEAKVVRGTAPSEVSPGFIIVLFIFPLVAVIGVNLGSTPTHFDKPMHKSGLDEGSASVNS